MKKRETHVDLSTFILDCPLRLWLSKTPQSSYIRDVLKSEHVRTSEQIRNIQRLAFQPRRIRAWRSEVAASAGDGSCEPACAADRGDNQLDQLTAGDSVPVL